MKNNVTRILCFLLLTATLTSCNKKRDLLLRTWKIEDVKLSKEVPQEAKAFFDDMIARMKANFRLTYKADGTYEANFGGRSNKGKWSLDKDEKIMTATDESGKTVTYKITELTKDKFVYVTNEGQESATFTFVAGEPLPANATPAEQPEADAMQPAEGQVDTAQVAGGNEEEKK
ncbi:MAG: lipocalin family protein [Chitinophagales bacterium]